jgi:hypothetical protein
LRVDRAKVVEYLLSHDHPDGAPKARFFEACGFSADDWEALAVALKRHGRENPVTNTVVTPFGTRYIVEGRLRTPLRREPSVRTVWIEETGSSALRLVTAYPA